MTIRVVLGALGLWMIGIACYQAIDAAITHGVHRNGGVYRVDLRALSDFDLDQRNGTTDDIPKQFRDLDGQRVALVGQMWAPFGVAGRLGGFDLVYSLSNCCFIGPPRVQHFVHATIPTGRSVDFHFGQVTATGTLHVGVQRSGGVIASVFRLDVEEVCASYP